MNPESPTRSTRVESDGWRIAHRPDGGVPRLGMTLGDAAGIGPEVVIQALLHTHVHRRVALYIFVAAELAPWLEAALLRYGLPRVSQAKSTGIQVVPVGVPSTGPVSLPDAGHSTAASRQQAFVALDAMADAAVRGEIDAMITGPVPKSIFDHLNPRPPGQTEFLADRLGAPRFAMMLAGPRLRVVPVTTHVALRDVAGLLSVERIVNCGLATADSLTRWFGIREPRLAVCGLNPHAGEGGRLGDEEARIIAPAVAELREHGLDAEGPVVADTVFHRAMNGRFDAVLCMYHDQALGPLKTVHFHDGYNLTCGLSVPRISPDHGTAYDIAGKGIADATSMIQAILRAEAMAAVQGPDAAPQQA